MKYKGKALGSDLTLSIEDEGIRIGSIFLDYADVEALSPINHRVMIDTISGEKIEISMLGHSFDGFWEELLERFGKRSLEALFVDEEQIMLVDGEYQLPAESGDQMRVTTERMLSHIAGERGRAKIALYPDSVCILPQTRRAVRIPLCYADEIRQDGYQLHIRIRSGEEYVVGKMGYETEAFIERTAHAAETVRKQRSAAVEKLQVTFMRDIPDHDDPEAAEDPSHQGLQMAKGIFRTRHPEQYWNAAFRTGVCALELFTGDDSATYLYRFDEPCGEFRIMLEEAMEAMGTHREVIYLTDEQLAEKPLYRMAADRMKAVRFLRARSAGRIIHNAAHDGKLSEFLRA